MIKKNLGNIERAIRFVAGVGMLVWALLQPQLLWLEWLLLLAASFLLLNGIFSRCYLWYLFDLNTCRKDACTRDVVD